MEKIEKNQKVTSMAMELYDDSCSPCWRQVLQAMHTPAFAIYHNHDIKIATGELKKPHWHVLIMFGRQIIKTYASRVADELGAANGYWESVPYKHGYARYMCHMDNPEKYQYNPNDVICFGGADYIEFTINNAEKSKIKNDILIEIIQMVRQNEIKSYAMVINFAIDNGNMEWLNVLRQNGAFIAEYIKSAEWANTYDPQYKYYENLRKLKEEKQKKADSVQHVEEEVEGTI